MKNQFNSIIFVLMAVRLFCLGEASQRYWVFFQDKPGSARLYKQPNREAASLQISNRALTRRSKVLGAPHLIDIHDLPVSEHYIHDLESLGVRIMVRSRWLNGVSIHASDRQMAKISNLHFVKSVQPVLSRSVKDPPVVSNLDKYASPSEHGHALEYGYSYSQLSQICVPDVHDLGIDGEGVFIGMIDSGFDTRGYRVFSKTNILNTYDFYWNDENTANEAGDSYTQHNHGTQTLSVVGGFEEGVLVGSAYGASFALAKTEWVPTETRMEEDLWIAALEWMESLGVDIVSTSLGYRDFDDGFAYTYEEMNGDVCLTSIASDIAARKGVLVLTSAGNEGDNSWRYILSPADGDSVVAVGAVDWNGTIAGFSSVGPTSDGRIKPDVMAMGMGVYSAKPGENGIAHYVSGNGTSFSCPLVAGVCALVLQAHPELTPMDVRDAIRETASQAEVPNNQYGWGIVNAYRALFYHGPFLHNFRFSQSRTTNDVRLMFNITADSEIEKSSVQFHCLENGTAWKSIPVNSSGDDYFIQLNAMPDLDQFGFYISLTDVDGKVSDVPYQAPDILYQFSGNGPYQVSVQLDQPESCRLLQNYPNPFNGVTQITFQISESGPVELRIYNVAGQRVATLLNESLMAGEYTVLWDGHDASGRSVSSGLYLYVLKASGYRESRKMILSR